MSIPITVTIPSRSTAGYNDGNISIVDDYTAKINCSSPIFVPKNAQANLTVGSFPYSYPNVADALDRLPGIPQGNNRISINWAGAGYVDYTIATGLYSFTDISYALNQIAIGNGWQIGATNLFIINGIQATQKIVLSLNPAALTGSVFPVGGVTISFANPSPVSGLNNSMGNLLGFNNVPLTFPAGGSVIVSYTGQSTANFNSTSAYVLNCSMVFSSSFQGASSQILYAFPLGNNSPNSVVEYQPSLKFTVPVSSNTYSWFNVWFSDQSGNKLKLQYFDGPILITFVISPMKSF